MTRDQVLDQMELRGGTQTMSNKRNAVNTALYRAVEKKRLQKVGDMFAPPPVGETSDDPTTTEGHPSSGSFTDLVEVGISA
ncbi:hypothetical protein GCM10022236_23780 [Microlunatus ginsengisoli]|uniref:Uncharacterized protein n=2 Tax=Microlunatus ginsengisoli TaxID=363863 RepID=A0ABP6ZZ81_9ACTN